MTVRSQVVSGAAVEQNMNTEQIQNEQQSDEGNHSSMGNSQQPKSSKGRLVIITILIIVAILGYIIPVAMKITNKQEEDLISNRIIQPIDYEAEASRVFSLPISWKVSYSTDETKGIGVRIDSIKSAFPSDCNIMVNFIGKAYFLNDETTHEYDLSLRLKLDVVPDNGVLRIGNIQIDNLSAFDATSEEMNALSGFEQQITAELQRHCNMAFANIPVNAVRIKEMTLDGITLYLKK
jgi:hypothetical protein